MLTPARQLLAVIEGAETDAEVVSQALGLVSTSGARIGFTDLCADRSRRRERMAKALAATHALGIPGEAWAPVADAAAAVALARVHHCDLLVTASPAIAECSAQQHQPVLVAAGTASPAAARVTAALHAEHRRQADAVHRALQQLSDACRRQAEVDAAAMRTAIDGLSAAGRHHEVEEQVLFAALRRRGHAWDAELDELSQQHRRDVDLLDGLRRAAQGLGAAAAPARVEATRALFERMQAYAAFVWEHQGREEGVVLPAAHRHLRDEVWASIEAALSAAAVGIDGSPAAGHRRADIATA